MTPHPKETSWACTRLEHLLPPSPTSGFSVDFQRSLEQQLRKGQHVTATNDCTNCWSWTTLIFRNATVKFCRQLVSSSLEFESWSVEADIYQQYHQDETSWGMNSERELLPVKSWRVTVLTRQMGEASEQSCAGIYHCQPHARIF